MIRQIRQTSGTTFANILRKILTKINELLCELSYFLCHFNYFRNFLNKNYCRKGNFYLLLKSDTTILELYTSGVVILDGGDNSLDEFQEDEQVFVDAEFLPVFRQLIHQSFHHFCMSEISEIIKISRQLLEEGNPAIGTAKKCPYFR